MNGRFSIPSVSFFGKDSFFTKDSFVRPKGPGPFIYTRLVSRGNGNPAGYDVAIRLLGSSTSRIQRTHSALWIPRAESCPLEWWSTSVSSSPEMHRSASGLSRPIHQQNFGYSVSMKQNKHQVIKKKITSGKVSQPIQQLKEPLDACRMNKGRRTLL